MLALKNIPAYLILWNMKTIHTDIYESISDIYDGKSVFVTGSSGFLGKIFVEKILYGCPKIAKVYVLLRESKKISAAEKLKNMLDCALFKRLKEERPQDLEKIIPITGDIGEPKLGINTEDESVLIEKVSMVFHIAATVKFNDPLPVTVNINVEGTRRVLELCAKIRNLKVFVYVSTAFSNANRKVINEVVYPPVLPLTDIQKLMEQKTYAREEMERFLGGLPNTYTLSKNLAESVVEEFREKHRFPAVIVRPSIIISCKNDPVKGWIDNWYGPTALAMAISKRVIRVLNGDGNNVIDLVPVDYVSNLVIIAGARCRRADTTEVYNCCSSDVNPITLREFTEHIIDSTSTQGTTTCGIKSFAERFSKRFTSPKNYVPNLTYLNWVTDYFPVPKLLFIKVSWWMILVTFLLETVPAYIADCIWRLFGKKDIHLKILSRICVVRKFLGPFTSRTWMMKSHNVAALADTLSSRDRHMFPCEATFINWNEYIPEYFRGVQKHLG